jgi:hypothetical protein
MGSEGNGSMWKLEISMASSSTFLVVSVLFYCSPVTLPCKQVPFLLWEIMPPIKSYSRAKTVVFPIKKLVIGAGGVAQVVTAPA